MRKTHFVVAGFTSVLALMPITELYAACTYTPVVGGEIRYCSNGTCESESRWQDNRLVEVFYVRCGGVSQV